MPNQQSGCPAGEDLIGAKAYRVIFAFTSLPLAALALVYFINHRYSGTPLWNLRGVPGVHAATWLLSFISFYFLYPSTFNILEVQPLHPHLVFVLTQSILWLGVQMHSLNGIHADALPQMFTDVTWYAWALLGI